MRICFYCDSIFTFGGVQRVLAGVAKELAKKHDVTILTRDNPEMEDKSMYGLDESEIRFQYLQYPKSPFYEYYPCKAYSFLYKKVLLQNELTTHLYTYSSFPFSSRETLIKTLNHGDFDTIVGVHVFPALFLAGIRKQLKARVVGWLHNSYDAFFCQPGIWLWKGEKRFQYQIKALDEIVVLTEDDRRLYRERMGLETTRVYNPLTLPPRGMGGPDHKKFLAVGRLTPLMKGFDILIEAFAIFARKNRDWTLDIVGEGPEEPLLRSIIAKHHLEQRVTLWPFTKEVQKHYASASVYVLSSRWEGFGLVLIEAMAHGLPIIASDVPVGLELLDDKEFGFIFKNGNPEALAEQMTHVANMETLEYLGGKAKENAERFDVANIAKEWEKVLLKE